MSADAGHHDAAGEAAAQRRGVIVIGLLAVLTLVEYLIAVTLDGIVALVVLLSVIALAKAWYIVKDFMHLPLVWRGEEGH